MRKELVSLIAYRRSRRLAVLPSVCLRNGLVCSVSEQFLELTGYEEEDFLSASKNDLLRLLRADFTFDNFRDKAYLYIFTRNLEPREIEIYAYADDEGTQLYLFEKPNSRLGKLFPFADQQLRYNMIGTAIFSAENFLLLSGNKQFMNCLDRPFNRSENSIGRSLHRICTGWTGSVSHAVWQHVIDTGEPYIAKATPYMGLKRGHMYTDVMIMPIKFNGKVKYLVESVRDVTDDVSNRKLIDRQAEQLKEQNARLETLLYTLSHELRNPLATITTGLSLMDILEVTPEIRETLELVKNETTQLRRLVDTLPDLTRLTKKTSLVIKDRFELNLLTADTRL